MKFDREQLERFSHSHETDEEIVRAIFEMAEDDEDADRIWNEPTEEELVEIKKKATKNGAGVGELHWGLHTLNDILVAAFPDTVHV